MIEQLLLKNTLVKYGVESSRIKAVGFGDTKPIATNDTEQGRAKNRRTEFQLIQG